MVYRTCGECGVMYPYIQQYFHLNPTGELEENCMRCSPLLKANSSESLPGIKKILQKIGTMRFINEILSYIQ